MALERLPLPATLLAHLQRRTALEDTLRRALPEELARHVFLLNVRGDTLVLGCDVQALITPLRFQAPKLLAAAGEILNEGRPVRVAWRTLPPPTQRDSQLRPRYPSVEIARGIEAAARCVTDPALGSALHRLARAVDKRNPTPTGH